MDTLPLIQQFPYFGIFTLLILGSVGFPFPEDAILILSGFLISQNIIRLIPALLIIYLALLFTDFTLYMVGKKYGRKIVEHKRFQKILSPDKLSRYEDKFKRFGGLTVFFGRHLLGLRAQIFIIAGIMRISALKFLIVDGISALITISLMVGIGYAGGNSIQILKQDISKGYHVLILIFIVIIIGTMVYGYFKTRTNE